MACKASKGGLFHGEGDKVALRPARPGNTAIIKVSGEPTARTCTRMAHHTQHNPIIITLVTAVGDLPASRRTVAEGLVARICAQAIAADQVLFEVRSTVKADAVSRREDRAPVAPSDMVVAPQSAERTVYQERQARS